MQQPKRVKYRKVQRGRRRGQAQAGNAIGFGDYGEGYIRFGLTTSIEKIKDAVERMSNLEI